MMKFLFVFIIALSFGADLLYAQQICVGEREMFYYQSDYPQAGNASLIAEGEEYEGTSYYDSYTRIHSFSFTPLEEKDYTIYYRETFLGITINKLEIDFAITVKSSLVLDKPISNSAYTAKAHSIVVLKSGFKVTGATAFKTEIGSCGNSTSSALVKKGVSVNNRDAGKFEIQEENAFEKPGFQFYPNPNKDKVLKLKIEDQDLPGKLTIYSLIQGSKQFEQDINSAKAEVVLPAYLPAGLYVVSYISSTSGSRYEGKLIIN